MAFIKAEELKCIGGSKVPSQIFKLSLVLMEPRKIECIDGSKAPNQFIKLQRAVIEPKKIECISISQAPNQFIKLKRALNENEKIELIRAPNQFLKPPRPIIKPVKIERAMPPKVERPLPPLAPKPKDCISNETRQLMIEYLNSGKRQKTNVEPECNGDIKAPKPVYDKPKTKVAKVERPASIKTPKPKCDKPKTKDAKAERSGSIKEPQPTSDQPKVDDVELESIDGIKSPKPKYEIISDEKRKLMIDYLDSADKPKLKDVAKIFQVNVKSLYRIYRNYKAHNVISRRPTGGPRAGKIDAEDEHFIKEQIDKDYTITSREIRNRLLSKRKKNVCNTTISRYCNKIKKSIKSTNKVVQKTQNLDLEVQRKSYCTLFKKIYQQQRIIIFYDETSFPVPSTMYGPPLKAAKDSTVLSGRASKNITVMSAICSEGFITFRDEDKPANKELLCDYLKGLCDILDEVHITNSYIIMNHAPFHTCFEIKELVAERGHDLLLIPKRSRFLNPFDNIFAQWKSYVKEFNPQTESHLKQLIMKFQDILTEEQINNYFRDTINNVNKYLSGCPSTSFK